MALLRTVSWKQCTTLRTSSGELSVAAPATPTSRRRRSLHRGALRFWRDVIAERKRHHRVLLFALTIDGLDNDATRGSVRELFHHMRKLQGGLRYLWWAEFQLRGAIHFHGVLVDPPFDFERDGRKWFDHHWPHARIQTWVEWRSWAWFKADGGKYALKDVRKVGGKTYEQNYEAMPAGWKTFSSHRLVYAAAEHQQHENKLHVVPASYPVEGQGDHDRVFIVERVDLHIPGEGGCRLHVRRGRGRALARAPAKR